METYEYSVVRERYRGNRRFEDLLAALRTKGEQGWGLVQASETPLEISTGGTREEAVDVVLYFQKTVRSGASI
jgi:hypothetical protein